MLNSLKIGVFITVIFTCAMLFTLEVIHISQHSNGTAHCEMGGE